MRSLCVVERSFERSWTSVMLVQNCWMYVGACPCSALYTNKQHLYFTLWGTYSQWSLCPQKWRHLVILPPAIDNSDRMMSSSSDFLIKGEIITCFHLDGNQSSTTEWLTTRVMYDANNETQSFISRVVIWSRVQCFVGDYLIIFVTRSTSTVLNWLRFDVQWTV